ncbi:MAG TPA: hypothetical protein VFE09_01000, partial [Rubrobacteraceae bacterium]|nr:hypothetical protein [Rubrobacteraceae bacterium]
MPGTAARRCPLLRSGQSRASSEILAQRGEVGSGEVSSASLTELRRVNKIRRDFVANVSHELKTPATSLKLLA